MSSGRQFHSSIVFWKIWELKNVLASIGARDHVLCTVYAKYKFLRRVKPSSMLLVPIFTPGWRETMWSRVSCLSKQHGGRNQAAYYQPLALKCSTLNSTPLRSHIWTIVKRTTCRVTFLDEKPYYKLSFEVSLIPTVSTNGFYSTNLFLFFTLPRSYQ